MISVLTVMVSLSARKDLESPTVAAEFFQKWSLLEDNYRKLVGICRRRELSYIWR